MRLVSVRPSLLLWFAALCGAGLTLAACTLIGAGVGAAWKTPKRDRMSPVETWQLVTARNGSWLEIQLRDDTGAHGSFRGIVPDESPRYLGDYETARRELSGLVELPALGAGGRFRRHDGPEIPCELLGVDTEGVFVREAPRDEPRTVPFAELAQLADRDGLAVSGDTLAELMRSGRLPSVRAIALEDKGVRQLVRVEDVASVEMAAWGGNATRGLLIGAAIDALVVMALVIADSGDEPAPSCGENPCQSCPFVYSFDGQGYRLDAEPFGGSFVERAQRTAWSSLEHLREVEGTYRLRLTDELAEIEHVDEVKLVVIDHPRGSRVAPDLVGSFHATASTAPPIAARDLSGADVLAQVRARDDGAWMAQPVRARLGDAAGARSGAVIEFARPADAREATLTLRARSTPWFALLLRRVLELPGSEREAWYARLSADPFAEASLLSFASEAFPAIRLWDGKSWTSVEPLGELPTVAWGTQAVRLDLTRVPGATFRVRVDGLPGTWILDSAEAGFGPELPLRTTELEASSAQTPEGRDVRTALRATDRVRHSMRPGESVDLVFEAPPRDPGLDRSFAVKSAGYYTILFGEDAAPQLARFEAIFNERGQLTRFASEALDAYGRSLLAEAR